MNVHMVVNSAPEIQASVPIGNLEALRALVDGQRHRIVSLLIEEALTATELADRLEIARTRLYYHLGLLERHGLIRVSETRLVSGISERRYRAVARAFRVDRTLLASGASDSEIAQTQAAIVDEVAADLHARATVAAFEDDLLVSRAFLHLNGGRRKELRAKLAALVSEYGEADSDGAETELAIALFTTKGQGS